MTVPALPHCPKSNTRESPITQQLSKIQVNVQTECNQIQLVLNPISVGTEAVSNIRKHSEVSLLAEQRTRGTASIVRHSEDTRNDALTMLDHQVLNTSNVLQQLRMMKSPGIQNLNEKVGAVDFEWKLKKPPNPPKTLFWCCNRFYFKRVLTCIFKSGKCHFLATAMQSHQKQLHFSAVVISKLEAIVPSTRNSLITL